MSWNRSRWKAALIFETAGIGMLPKFSAEGNKNVWHIFDYRKYCRLEVMHDRMLGGEDQKYQLFGSTGFYLHS